MYSVTVKIDDIEKRRRSAGLLHVVIGFFIIAKASDYYKQLDYLTIVPVLPFFSIGIISLLYGFFRKRIDLTARYNYSLRLTQVICFTAFGIVFMNLGSSIDYIGVFLFAGLTILLLFSERKIFNETILAFDENGISIPGYYRDHLVKWNELTEVVVREDFITLFHIRKKYLQYQVMQDLSMLEVAKLNGFCRDQIEAAGVKVNS